MEITELRNVSAPTNMAVPEAQRRWQILTDPLVVPVYHIPFSPYFLPVSLSVVRASSVNMSSLLLIIRERDSGLSRVFVPGLTWTDKKINSVMTGCFSPLTQCQPIFKNMPVDGTSKWMFEDSKPSLRSAEWLKPVKLSVLSLYWAARHTECFHYAHFICGHKQIKIIQESRTYSCRRHKNPDLYAN